MPATTTRRSIQRTVGPFVIGPAVAIAAVIAAHLSPSLSSAPSLSRAFPPGAQRALPRSTPSPAPAVTDVHRDRAGDPPAAADGGVTKADGVLPGGVTVFDVAYPGVADLDPDLLRALRAAAMDAAGEAIELHVTSGWRSRGYQDVLLREAVAQYGSAAEAARWVATADTSPHVSGDAVDIGPTDAAAWLAKHGARYGLCRIYRNEPWHFELRPEAVDGRCPRMYADPRQDPRMRA